MVSEKFKCVCFFSNTAIGDTLFNTPVFREFRAKFSDVKTIALLNPNNAVLFRDDPNLDEIITYNGRWGGFLRTLKILKSKKIDICFLLHSNEPQATPLAILSGAKYVFKLPNHKNKFNFLHSNTPQKYADENRYIVLNRLLQLKFVGIDSDESLAKDEICRLSLYLNPADYVRVDEKLKNLNGEQKYNKELLYESKRLCATALFLITSFARASRQTPPRACADMPQGALVCPRARAVQSTSHGD